jgi:hypothetical protein
MKVSSVILSVFTWGHNDEVTVEFEHWCGKIPVETSRDVKVSDEFIVDSWVCMVAALDLRGRFQGPVTISL